MACSAAVRPPGSTPTASSGRPAAQGAERAEQRADQAVAGEERGALAVGHPVRQQRLLERQEQADIAGGRVERADEADDERAARRR